MIEMNGSNSEVITILLAEGDPILRDLISLALQRRSNVQVSSALDGMQALELCRQLRPQLILIDILLPHVNGLDLMQRMKKEGLLDDAQILIISALGYREVVQQAVQAGACDFLVKPFSVEFLIGRVHLALERRLRIAGLSAGELES